MSAEVENAPVEGEPVDDVTAPAIAVACERCGERTLLRPGGLCPSCVAAIGLAEDRGEYDAWRSRVERDIASGP
ncbi:MAG: hypothetical protein M3235_17665 [Actinomycetota bacterium]|nr:hypothetical protein [Actinomycetota bacterium]